MMEKEPEILEYPKCPVCDSEVTLIASLAAEEIARGISPTAVAQHLQVWPFVVRNPNYPIIIGSKSSAGTVFIVMCKGCGIIRAVRAEIGEAIALDRPQRG